MTPILGIHPAISRRWIHCLLTLPWLDSDWISIGRRSIISRTKGSSQMASVQFKSAERSRQRRNSTIGSHRELQAGSNSQLARTRASHSLSGVGAKPTDWVADKGRFRLQSAHLQSVLNGDMPFCDLTAGALAGLLPLSIWPECRAEGRLVEGVIFIREGTVPAMNNGVHESPVYVRCFQETHLSNRGSELDLFRHLARYGNRSAYSDHVRSDTMKCQAY
jgi:hypothetical protein